MPSSIHTPAYRKLCRLLVEARKSESLTQVELAKRLERPQSFVSKIENGERRLDVVEFLEITEILNLDPCSVLDEVKEVIDSSSGDNRRE
jgi:transcriptional regulator with XRE-family HTH domain